MYIIHAGNDVYAKDKLSDVLWMSLVELRWTDEVYVCNVNDALLLQLTYNVVTIRDTDINQLEAIIYPALADAIVAEQHRLTDEDIQAIAVTVSAVLTMLNNDYGVVPSWDIPAADRLITDIGIGIGTDNDKELWARLAKVQKKLFNQKAIELDKEYLVL